MAQKLYRREKFGSMPLNGHAVPAVNQMKSEEVQDIMSKMPHWMVRRGTTVLFFVITMLFAGAWFIHYPDIIATEVSIISSNPPVKIFAQASGKIQLIFVKNNQSVKKDETVCVLENPASYKDMITLKNILTELDTSLQLPDAIRSISFNQYVQLGELQGGYADLYQSISQYIFFTEKNFLNQKVSQLKTQMAYQSQLDNELKNRDILLKQQLSLEKKKFIADSSLVIDKVIAPLEFDNSKKELINKQMNADATRTSMLQNKLQQTEYLKNITDLQQQKLQQENDLKQKIRENVKRLQGQMEIWEQHYLIKSPVEGKATFFKFWKENQYITSGEPVVVIVPPVQSYIAKSSLPLDGAGKVRAGQKVLIKLSAYPFQEFGMIEGRVRSVSSVPLDTAYSMEINLSNGLTTTLHKQIVAQPQLAGTAEVLTNNKSILKRLFEKIWVSNTAYN